MLSSKAESIIAAARLNTVTMDNPKLSDLPFDNFRDHQITAIEQVVDAFQHSDLVVLDAPTGSGKTLIAEAVRRMLGLRAIYCCHSINLQHQFITDYNYAALLKGRSNYTPELVEGLSQWNPTCADCLKDSCNLCSSMATCPYESAKMEAVASTLTVLNTQYLLTEGNTAGRFRGRPLVILDECDTLESELMRYCEVEISERRARQYKIAPPKVTVMSSWVDWFQTTIPKIETARTIAKRKDQSNLRHSREVRYLDRLLESLRWVAPQIEDNWVYTGRDGYISFKPVTVDQVAKKVLWPLGKKFLLMSATVVSAENLLGNLGWDKDYRVVSVPHTFPLENRRIHIRPVVRMNKDADPSALIPALQQIIRDHIGERLLLHCVSYRLAGYLHGELSGSCREVGMGCETYTRSDEKSRAIATFRSTGGGLLIAPSLDRGVDLPDDDCRVIIVAKIPYPNLGDRQISARLYSKGGQVWYNVQTVRTLVQMTGRGVRHADDHCTTYILDASFQDLHNKARGLLPSWFREALVWR